MAFSQEQMDALNGYSSAVTPDQASGAYASSNSFMQQMVASQSQQQEEQKNPFSNAIQNIASGNSQDNVQHAEGALKQIGSDLASVGAQNAGPVGKDMLAHAPALAQDLNGLTQKLQPTNLQQMQGASETALGEGLIPFEGAAKIPGKIVESIGQKVGEMVIPKTEKEAGMIQSYKAGNSFLDRVGSFLSGNSKAPTTAGKTAFDQGLMGTESMMGVQAKRAQGKIWTSLVKPALDQSPTKVDIPSFFDKAAEKITTDTNDPTRQKSLLQALESIKEDFGNIGNISLAQLQKYKEGWAEFVPEKAYKGQPIAGALNDVRNVLAGMARENIYSSLGGEVKQAYLDYGNLHAITALGKKAMAGSKFKGGAGSFIHGLWEMTTVPSGTIAGQALYKIGEGLEVVGLPGARTLGEVLGIQQQASTQSSPDQQQTQ